LNNDLKELIKLSDIDKSIDSFSPKIESANRKLERAKAKLDSIIEKRDATNQLIEDNNRKISEYENQLEMLHQQLKDITKKNKIVTTEKEVKALTVEEEVAKENMSNVNEEIDKLQNINEKKSIELDEFKEEIERESALVESIIKDVEEITSDIDSKKSALYAKREGVTLGIKPNVLQFYERIRMWARNSAIVPMRKQACYGCFMRLNDKTYADIIKAEEIITCPHCDRIIYMEPVEEED